GQQGGGDGVGEGGAGAGVIDVLQVDDGRGRVVRRAGQGPVQAVRRGIASEHWECIKNKVSSMFA
ncbi:hypothetical protein CFC21_059707, partial [Triticum aestivum]